VGQRLPPQGSLPRSRAATLLGAQLSCFTSPLIGSWSCRSVDLPSFLRELTELSARAQVLSWSRPTTISLLRRETTVGLVLSCRDLARRLGSMDLPRTVDLPSFLGKLTVLGARSSCGRDRYAFGETLSSVPIRVRVEAVCVMSTSITQSEVFRPG